MVGKCPLCEGVDSERHWIAECDYTMARQIKEEVRRSLEEYRESLRKECRERYLEREIGLVDVIERIAFEEDRREATEHEGRVRIAHGHLLWVGRWTRYLREQLCHEYGEGAASVWYPKPARVRATQIITAVTKILAVGGASLWKARAIMGRSLAAVFRMTSNGAPRDFPRLPHEAQQVRRTLADMQKLNVDQVWAPNPPEGEEETIQAVEEEVVEVVETPPQPEVETGTEEETQRAVEEQKKREKREARRKKRQQRRVCTEFSILQKVKPVATREIQDIINRAYERRQKEAERKREEEAALERRQRLLQLREERRLAARGPRGGIVRSPVQTEDEQTDDRPAGPVGETQSIQWRQGAERIRRRRVQAARHTLNRQEDGNILHFLAMDAEEVEEDDGSQDGSDFGSDSSGIVETGIG